MIFLEYFHIHLTLQQVTNNALSPLVFDKDYSKKHYFLLLLVVQNFLKHVTFFLQNSILEKLGANNFSKFPNF